MNENEEHKLVEAKDFKFCPWCGSNLQPKKLDGRERSACVSCDFIWYRNPLPAAGAIIFKDNSLLLVKRKYAPQIGDWCLPAGFMEYDESPVQCCVREVKEETGLEIEIDRLFWNYQAGDDPRAMVVLILYLAKIRGGVLTPGDDAIEAEYFKLDNLPENIAFDAHIRAIGDFKSYLKTNNLPNEND